MLRCYDMGSLIHVCSQLPCYDMLIPALLEYPMEQLLERCTMRPGRYQEDGFDIHFIKYCI